MIKINLLPKEILEKEKGKKLIVLIVLACVAILSVVLGLYAMRFLKYNGLKSHLAGIENKLKPLQSVIVQVDEIEAEKAKLKTKIQVIETLLKDSLIYPHMLEDLSALIPKKVWVNWLDTKSKEGVLDLSMSLSASNNYGVANFTAILEDNERFNNVVLGSISSVKMSTGVEIRNFDIRCEYRIGSKE